MSKFKEDLQTLCEVCDIDEEFGKYILENSNYKEDNNLYKALLLTQKSKNKLKRQFNDLKNQKEEFLKEEKKKTIKESIAQLDELFLSNKKALLAVERVISEYSPQPQTYKRTTKNYQTGGFFDQEWEFPSEENEEDKNVKKIMKMFDLFKEDAHRLLQKNVSVLNFSC